LNSNYSISISLIAKILGQLLGGIITEIISRLQWNYIRILIFSW